MPKATQPPGYLVTVDQVRAAKRELEADLTSYLMLRLADLRDKTGMAVQAIGVEFNIVHKIGQGRSFTFGGVSIKMEDI
jgi:hypothetical protein